MGDIRKEYATMVDSATFFCKSNLGEEPASGRQKFIGCRAYGLVRQAWIFSPVSVVLIPMSLCPLQINQGEPSWRWITLFYLDKLYNLLLIATVFFAKPGA